MMRCSQYFNQEFALVYEEKAMPEMAEVPDGYVMFACEGYMNFAILVE